LYEVITKGLCSKPRLHNTYWQGKTAIAHALNKNTFCQTSITDALLKVVTVDIVRVRYGRAHFEYF